MGLSKEIEQALIAKVLEGNQRAFQKLVVEYQHFVFTIVNRIVNQSEDAEDIAQEVFVKVYRSLNKFNGSSKFSTWLYRIATNTAISHRRKKRFNTQEISTTQITNTINNQNNITHNEQKKYIHLVFEQLSEDDVTLLTLFYLQELQLNEIAEILQLETNNVKVKLYRARKRMAEKLKLILKNEVKTIY